MCVKYRILVPKFLFPRAPPVYHKINHNAHSDIYNQVKRKCPNGIYQHRNRCRKSETASPQTIQKFEAE